MEENLPYNLPMATLPLTVERLGSLGGPGVLCLHGPLTMENVLSFLHAVRREEHAECMVLDLTEVPYIDSSGLGSLVSACIARQKAGLRVALAGVNERVIRLLEITKTESLFLIFPTIDDAIVALTSTAQA